MSVILRCLVKENVMAKMDANEMLCMYIYAYIYIKINGLGEVYLPPPVLFYIENSKEDEQYDVFLGM